MDELQISLKAGDLRAKKWHCGIPSNCISFYIENVSFVCISLLRGSYERRYLHQRIHAETILFTELTLYFILKYYWFNLWIEAHIICFKQHSSKCLYHWLNWTLLFNKYIFVNWRHHFIFKLLCCLHSIFVFTVKNLHVKSMNH